MTNAEFQKKLNEMYAKHPMSAKSKVKSINELMYVLRIEGDEDYQIITNTGLCIPSVRKAFVPTHLFARKVKSIEYEDYNDEYDGKPIHCSLVIVDLEDEEGSIDYRRAIQLLKRCMENIEQWNDCRNELTLGEFEDIGFEDEEIEELGFSYVLDVRDEEYDD